MPRQPKDKRDRGEAYYRKPREEWRERRGERPAKEDGGNPHLRVRVPKEMADRLQLLADEKYEGNLSILLRKILEHYLRKPFSLE